MVNNATVINIQCSAILLKKSTSHMKYPDSLYILGNTFALIMTVYIVAVHGDFVSVQNACGPQL
jgi:hypothetical protein